MALKKVSSATATPSPKTRSRTKSRDTAQSAQLTDLRTAGLYRIAAVSRLTGMPVPTLRMWERRYTVVSPARSSGNGRLYSRSDVDRLLLLKAASEAGHAIGTIAGLSDEQLRERLQQTSLKPAVATAQALCRVLVCGSRLAERLRESWSDRSDIAVTASLPNLSSPKLAKVQPADAVIVEASTLQISALAALRQLRQRSGAKLMIVV